MVLIAIVFKNVDFPEALIRWFARYSLPKLQKDPKICVLMNNTDLGVGD